MNAQEITQILLAKLPEGLPLEIPPKVFLDMGGEFVNYQEGVLLRARYPVLERYQNPLGYMQGGIISALMDNTMGPLSFLVAPPSVTTQLSVSFIRPVTPDETYIEVEAVIIEQTKKQLHMQAYAYSTAGKRLAIGYATAQVIV